MFFSKAQYERVTLPYYCYISNEDIYSSSFNIEAKGYVYGELRYFVSCFSVSESDHKEMLLALKNAGNKQVDVILKAKKGVLRDFKLDIKSLADGLCDERFLKMELSGWSMNFKPLSECDPQYKKI